MDYGLEAAPWSVVVYGGWSVGMRDWICTAGTSAGCVSVSLLLQLLIAAFLAILFLQSGLDKITDRKGNLEWLTGHFKDSPFANVVPLILTQVTVLEMAAGLLSAGGVVMLLLGQGSLVAFLGALLSAVSLICLFLGQRLAKDYDGAAVLVNYFILTLIAVYVMAPQ